MDFRLLGPLEVAEHDTVLELGGIKQRSLLALLLLHANEIVPTERLIDELWSGAPPATVAKSVQVYVSRLRRRLGDGRILTRTPGYVLNVGPSELDLARFERLVAEADGAEPAPAARRLREALAVWRGPPLADLAYEPFAQAHIARLEELRLAALEQRINADLATGRHRELAGELDALTREHPLRESLCGQLMLCLYRCGRQAEALDVYLAARTRLVEQRGIEPGRDLRALHGAILAQDPVLDAPATAGAVTARSPGLFVGRRRELAELVAGFEAAAAGRGRLFLLVGEPGIGKSRLADELARHARARDARVLMGRCWEAGGAPAYWPWIQALRDHVRECDLAVLRAQLGPGAADLTQIMPDLPRRLSDLPSTDPEGARFRLLDAAGEFLRNAARDRPIVMVLDDLHAADEPSLLLLRFVARELGASRLLVIGTCRDVDPVPGAELSETLAAIAREPAATRLVLRGLTEPEVAEYLGTAASELASPELAAALHERSDGNPLFVEEMVRLLSIEGAGEALRPAIPQSVRDVIAHRLGHLSDECRKLLIVASVLGREFALDVLAWVSGVPEEALIPALEEAIDIRVLTDVPGAPGRLRFAHVLIRDALYESLPSARRAQLHRRVVDALEAGEDRGSRLAMLARHCMAAGDTGKALRHFREAGDRALDAYAYEEAARLFRLALDALTRQDDEDAPTRCDLLLRLGDALSKAGSTDEAKATFVVAGDLARRARLPEHVARAALGYGGRSSGQRAGDDDRLVARLEEALAVLGPRDSPLRARLLARLAGALRDMPSLEPRCSLSRDAVAMARRLGDKDTLAYALAARFMASWGPETAPLEAIAEEVAALAEETGGIDATLDALTMRGILAWLTLAETDAAALDVEFDALAEKLKQPAQRWQGSVTNANWALFRGDLAVADRLAAEAARSGEARRWDSECSYRLTLFALRREQGRLDEVEDLTRDAAARYEGYRSFRCFVPLLDVALGRERAARRAFDELADGDFAALPRDSEWLFCLAVLAEVAADLADRDRATVLYRLLEPYPRVNAMAAGEIALGPVARYLGILATTMGRWDDAVRHHELALEANSRIGARPLVAHTRHDYGRTLLARDAPGDGDRAYELLADAASGFRELGMYSWADQVSGSSSSPAP